MITISLETCNKNKKKKQNNKIKEKAEVKKKVEEKKEEAESMMDELADLEALKLHSTLSSSQNQRYNFLKKQIKNNKDTQGSYVYCITLSFFISLYLCVCVCVIFDATFCFFFCVLFCLVLHARKINKTKQNKTNVGYITLESALAALGGEIKFNFKKKEKKSEKEKSMGKITIDDILTVMEKDDIMQKSKLLPKWYAKASQ